MISRLKLRFTGVRETNEWELPTFIKYSGKLAALAFMAIALATPSSASAQSSSSSSNSTGFTTDANKSAFESRSKRSSRSTNDKTDSTRNREQKKRDQSRNKNSNQPGTRGATSAQSGKQATAKGKQPDKKKGAGGTNQPAATTVEFKMKPDPTANVVYIEQMGQAPTMNMLVKKGENLDTRIMVRNGKRAGLEKIRLNIKYDPAAIKPLGIDDSVILPFLSAPSRADVDPAHGIICYSADFSDPFKQELFSPFKIKWQTIAPASQSPLVFLNTPDMPSLLLDNDSNILQSQNQETGELELSDNAGLLNANVTVMTDNSPDDDTSEREEVALGGMALAKQISDGAAEGGITLSLNSHASSVRVGEEFFVDVLYSNPKRIEIDRVCLLIRFDPKILQVIDEDEGNWITKDLNIADADSHDNLPFDFHIRNIAYNATGEIKYEMGFRQKTAVPISAKIATIRFRAIALSPMARIWFQLDESNRNPGTSLSFLGFNLIGVPGEREKSLTNATISIN
ncbi:MAG: hypothetical protein WCK47_02140 [bacterium]|nr:hypothetical protein [Candidatus Sumerlaeota bacterium]